MANIVERTISSVDDKRLSLVGEQVARTITIGTNWTQLRVLLYYSANSATTDDVIVPSFYFGLCSGTTSLPGDVSVDHFLGLSFPPSLNFITSLTTSWRTVNSATNGRLSRIQNSSETTTSVGADSAYLYLARSANVRKVILLNITKGASWTVQAIHSTASSDNPPSEIPTIMTTGIVSNASNLFNTTIAVDEATYGDLNSLCLSWGHDSIPLEISDIAYARIA